MLEVPHVRLRLHDTTAPWISNFLLSHPRYFLREHHPCGGRYLQPVGAGGVCVSWCARTRLSAWQTERQLNYLTKDGGRL